MTRAVMIQGTGSNVGKSLIVAGLARALAARGLSVAPFKPQNMSNNAAVTVDGGEIGRAQALQARAAGIAPTVDLNPVLLKPETETGAQVILRGERVATLKARDYARWRQQALPAVLESYRRLCARHDVVLVEGAGSPAETNLRAGDIANMGFAQAAGVPVVLVGDIDRGGVIAQIVGTHAVLDAADRARIRGFAVNRFRGDVSLFADGAAEIARRTGWADLGTIPWFADAARLPGEDVLDAASSRGGPVKIAVPRLPRIANFDDLDPLKLEPGVTVEIVPPGRPLPGDAALVLIPGSKSTIADLAAFRREGWDIDLAAHVRRGGRVLGICGGYQILGRRIEDPQGLEGPPGGVDGLGLLDVTTVMAPAKQLALRSGLHVESGRAVTGYEIHLGHTEGPDCARPFLDIDGPHGAVSANGQVAGCYLHGIFAADGFRAAFLAGLGVNAGSMAFEATVDATLDALAAHLAEHLDIDAILRIAQEAA